LPVSGPAVSQHLKVLKEAGLVIERAEGSPPAYPLKNSPRTEGMRRQSLYSSERSWLLRRSLDMEALVVERERKRVTVSEELVDFCNREYPQLVGTLTLYCGNPDVAEELAQETLARACSSWSKVRRMDAPGPWVNRVAINLANSYFRRRAAERRATERLETPMSSRNPDTALSVTIRRAVAALPKRQRTALVFRYFGDLSVAQVAELMGASEGAVRRLTHTAIASLRKQEGLQDLEVSDAS
jgi:RNA polymerase sigma-70 factor (ECF subfamily)